MDDVVFKAYFFHSIEFLLNRNKNLDLQLVVKWKPFTETFSQNVDFCFLDPNKKCSKIKQTDILKGSIKHREIVKERK
jgi:hypothetical protein